MHMVRGNCDWGGGADQLLIDVDGVRFFLTHGHSYGVKTGLQALVQESIQKGAQVVCYGHTHIAHWELVKEGLWAMNPGTIGGVRARKGYGLLYVHEGQVRGELK